MTGVLVRVATAVIAELIGLVGTSDLFTSQVVSRVELVDTQPSIEEAKGYAGTGSMSATGICFDVN